MKLSDKVQFFIIYPLNLEDLGLIELDNKFKQHFPDNTFNLIAKVPGGLLIECLLSQGLCLNYILRTPTRILLRLFEFKCRDAPKLFQKTSKFNWAPWLLGQRPEVNSSTVNSRLFDSRKIAKAIQDGVLEFYRHKPVKKKYLNHLQTSTADELPDIYCRIMDDLSTISIDTTGERLHLRGEKILTGNAPIRENLAALLLIELKKFLKKDRRYQLIDPMCGSGTFLFEAHNAEKITYSRTFSFHHFPVWLDAHFNFSPAQTNANEETFATLKGYDIDPEIAIQAKKNLLDKNIQIEIKDLFNDQKIEKLPNTAIIMNPPYGIRVGRSEQIDLTYYLNIIKQIKNQFNCDVCGIIIPAEYKLKESSQFQIASIRPFKNGGIDVIFYVLLFK